MSQYLNLKLFLSIKPLAHLFLELSEIGSWWEVKIDNIFLVFGLHCEDVTGCILALMQWAVFWGLQKLKALFMMNLSSYGALINLCRFTLRNGSKFYFELADIHLFVWWSGINKVSSFALQCRPVNCNRHNICQTI